MLKNIVVLKVKLFLYYFLYVHITLSLIHDQIE